MSRKRLVVDLIVAIVLVAFAVFVGRQVWLGRHGKDASSGPQEAIPVETGPLVPTETGQADWPCWRGRNGDGMSLVTNIRKDWSGGLKKLWEVHFLCQGRKTLTWSSPVVQGNRLVVPGRDEERDLVFCLNPDSGELLWIGSYEADAQTSHGSGARATPFIDEDRVYTFGRSGDLACWRLMDGQLAWRQNVKEVSGAELAWGHASSPLVYEDKVVVQGGDSAVAVAYHKMTGRLVWKAMEGKAGYAAPTLAHLGDAAKLLILHSTGLACLDPADGSKLWSVPQGAIRQINATTPIVTGSTVFVTSGYAQGCQAVRLHDDTVEVLWRNKAIASQHSDPAIIDGFIYGYSGQSKQNKGYFKCVELESGNERWRTTDIGWGTAVQVDGHLLCMDIKGNLFLVRPDPTGLKKVTEFKGALGDVRHPAWTIPVIANGRLYLRYVQHLVCYSLMATEH